MTGKYLYRIETESKADSTMWSPHLSHLLVSLCGVDGKLAKSKTTSLVRLLHKKDAILAEVDGKQYWVHRKLNEEQERKRAMAALYDLSTAPNKNNTSGKIRMGLTLEALYDEYFRSEYGTFQIFEQSVRNRIDTQYPSRGVALLMVSHSSTFSAGYGRSHANIGYAYITRSETQ